MPLLLGGTTGELQDKEWLGANGVKVALQGHLPFSAAVKAVYDTLKALRDGVPPADLRGQHRQRRDDGPVHSTVHLPAVDGGFPELGFRR